MPKKDKSTLIEYVDPEKIKFEEKEMVSLLSGEKKIKPVTKTAIEVKKSKLSKLSLSFIKRRRAYLQENFMYKGWSLVNTVLETLEEQVKEHPEKLTPKGAAALLDILLKRLEIAENVDSEGNVIEKKETLKLSDEMLDKLIEVARERKQKERKVIDVE